MTLSATVTAISMQLAALALILTCGDDQGVPVVAVLAVVVVWRYAIKGKGAPAARLAALLCAIIVALVALAAVNPHSAGMTASGFAGGIKTAAEGIGRFIGAL